MGIRWMFFCVDYYMYGSFLFLRFRDFFLDESRVGVLITTLARHHAPIVFLFFCTGMPVLYEYVPFLTP